MTRFIVKTTAFIFVMLLVVSCKESNEPYSDDLSGTVWAAEYDSNQGMHYVFLDFDNATLTQTTYLEDGSILLKEVSKYSYNQPNVIGYDNANGEVIAMGVVDEDTMVWAPKRPDDKHLIFKKQ